MAYAEVSHRRGHHDSTRHPQPDCGLCFQEAREQQRTNNDTGYPHWLNGLCQAERHWTGQNGESHECCDHPLQGTIRDGEPQVWCDQPSCPRYDLPRTPAPGIQVYIPEPLESRA